MWFATFSRVIRTIAACREVINRLAGISVTRHGPVGVDVTKFVPTKCGSIGISHFHV